MCTAGDASPNPSRALPSPFSDDEGSGERGVGWEERGDWGKEERRVGREERGVEPGEGREGRGEGSKGRGSGPMGRLALFSGPGQYCGPDTFPHGAEKNHLVQKAVKRQFPPP